MSKENAATVVAMKLGLGMSQAKRRCERLTEDQCERIVAAVDATGGDQVVRSILSEPQDGATEPDLTDVDSE